MPTVAILILEQTGHYSQPQRLYKNMNTNIFSLNGINMFMVSVSKQSVKLVVNCSNFHSQYYNVASIKTSLMKGLYKENTFLVLHVIGLTTILIIHHLVLRDKN